MRTPFLILALVLTTSSCFLFDDVTPACNDNHNCFGNAVCVDHACVAPAGEVGEGEGEDVGGEGEGAVGEGEGAVGEGEGAVGEGEGAVGEGEGEGAEGEGEGEGEGGGCLQPFVCGDGCRSPDEECDDGAGNSDFAADACRS